MTRGSSSRTARLGRWLREPIAHSTSIAGLSARLERWRAEICRRRADDRTWLMAQTQEEFYFALPYTQMDLCLYGLEKTIPVAEVTRATGLTPEQVMLVWEDIEAKRKATRYLHAPPLLIETRSTTARRRTRSRLRRPADILRTLLGHPAMIVQSWCAETAAISSPASFDGAACEMSPKLNIPIMRLLSSMTGRRRICLLSMRPKASSMLSPPRQ